jgi:hypothetical protein
VPNKKISLIWLEFGQSAGCRYALLLLLLNLLNTYPDNRLGIVCEEAHLSIIFLLIDMKKNDSKSMPMQSNLDTTSWKN